MVFKKTSAALSTTLIAAVVNILIGVGLIQSIGLYAPALGTAVSFCVQWIIRMYQLRENFKVKVDLKALSILLVFGSIITTIYYINNMILQSVSLLIGFIVFIIINKEFILNTLRNFMRH